MSKTITKPLPVLMVIMKPELLKALKAEAKEADLLPSELAERILSEHVKQPVNRIVDWLHEKERGG